MRLTTRLQMLEAKLRPASGPPRFLFILEDEDGIWHNGRGEIIDPVTVTGPLRIIRLVADVGFPALDDLLEPSSQ